MNDDGADIAMQTRCVHCLREQYALIVYVVSNGTHPCVWCGRHSHEMTEAAYQETLRIRRLRDTPQ